MNEECLEAGLRTDFRSVPSLVEQGSPEAKKLWESESFGLRWDYYEKATWQIAGGPGSELPVLPLAGYPMIANVPSSPNIQLYQQTGLYAGLALGGLVGYRRSLRIKISDGPKSADSVPIPAYAEVAPPPLPGSAESKRRVNSPEDDW